MDARHKVSMPIIIAGLLLTCISSAFFYNIGYSKSSAVNHKPIYIKYTSMQSKNLHKELDNVGISADGRQVENLARNLKASGKHVR